jgi:hypothetical protein
MKLESKDALSTEMQEVSQIMIRNQCDMVFSKWLNNLIKNTKNLGTDLTDSSAH